MARRRRPLIFEEKVQRRLDRIGRETGRGQANARPVRSAPGATAKTGTTGTVMFAYDHAVAAAGMTSMRLNNIPIRESTHVYLNGLELREDVDWSQVAGVLTLLPPADVRADDLIDVRYAHRGVPAAPEPPPPPGPAWVGGAAYGHPSYYSHFVAHGAAGEIPSNNPAGVPFAVGDLILGVQGWDNPVAPAALIRQTHTVPVSPASGAARTTYRVLGASWNTNNSARQVSDQDGGLVAWSVYRGMRLVSHHVHHTNPDWSLNGYDGSGWYQYRTDEVAVAEFTVPARAHNGLRVFVALAYTAQHSVETINGTQQLVNRAFVSDEPFLRWRGSDVAPLHQRMFSHFGPAEYPTHNLTDPASFLPDYGHAAAGGETASQGPVTIETAGTRCQWFVAEFVLEPA